MTDRDTWTRASLSRRVFIRRVAGGAAAVGAASTIPACADEADEPPTGDAGHLPLDRQYPKVPGPPPETPAADSRRFFTRAEARAFEALAATIMPGDPDDPGAIEAGVPTYVDYKLGTYPGGEATRSYTKGPYAETYTGEAPPDAVEELLVAEDELDRYGPQSPLTRREVYRGGLASLDRHARTTRGRAFADLDTAAQEDIVGALADDTIDGFDEPTASAFYAAVRQDVAEGMFSDPAYGGNRGFAGWRLIGYPGAQRAWTPDDLKGRTPDRDPQGLAELHPLHPGVGEGDGRGPDGPELPVRDGEHSGEQGAAFCPIPQQATEEATA